MVVNTLSKQSLPACQEKRYVSIRSSYPLVNVEDLKIIFDEILISIYLHLARTGDCLNENQNTCSNPASGENQIVNLLLMPIVARSGIQAYPLGG
jgi:hypothetical protein